MGRLSEKVEGDKVELLYFLERLRVQPLSYVQRGDLEMLWDLWYSSPSKVQCLLRVYKGYWQQSSEGDVPNDISSVRDNHLSRQCIRDKLEESVGNFRDSGVPRKGHQQK